jgi:hypothetical protein
VTAIAVVRAGNEIILAADSLNTSSDSTSRTLRKIHDLGLGIFAVSFGLNGCDETGFDVPTILAAVRDSKPKTVWEALGFIQKQIMESFGNTILYLYENEREVFDQVFRGKTGIVVAGYQDRPEIGTLFFDITISNERPVAMSKIDFAPNGDVNLLLSPSGNCDIYREKHWPLKEMSPLEFAVGFIQTEINNGTPNVGPPIDILRLDATGSEWFQR